MRFSCARFVFQREGSIIARIKVGCAPTKYLGDPGYVEGRG